ncbi:MAG: thiamine pyrophosphate-requiring protein [Planctomycetaceae bacterium]|jgi:thiamine pyrophosphate-dependent acetolactate synthase large subunit-like protein|nr:thiamine pyrophosphate-requiring protein [Planctomycetaceae bacterium]
MRGDQVIAEILKREGVEQIFLFPFTPILEAVSAAGIRPIVARQERVAENMADGFSRITNGARIGTVTVQQAAGAENAFAGIAQALTDSSPILFLPGGMSRLEAGTPPSFDAVPNFAATTKWADRIPTADAIPQRMRRAFTALRTGRPGPVMLEVPVDVAVEDLSTDLDYQPVAAARAGTDPDAIRDAAKLLLAAERPMIWAGQGVLYAEATAAVTAVAEFLGAPVMTTLLGKSGFDETHPLSLGTGSHSCTDMAIDYLDHCDAILALGTSLTHSVFAPDIPAGKRIVHNTIDPRDLNKHHTADVPLLGDCRLAAESLLEELKSVSGSGEGRPEREVAEAHVAGTRAAWDARWAEKLTSDQVPLNPYRVIGEFMALTDPAQTIVTHDSGNPRDQLVPLYRPTTPRGYLGWGHSTQLGFGLGAMMGAKLACPEKLCVNFMGDAAIGMVGMDIETAVREEIPILTVVLKNSAMGNYEKHIPISVEKYGTKFLTGDYADLARALGAHGERVEQPADIRAAFERGIAANAEGKPALIEFITCEEPDMAIPPRS